MAKAKKEEVKIDPLSASAHNKAPRKAKAPVETTNHDPDAQTPLADVLTTKEGKKVKLPKAKGTVSLGKVVDMLYARREREKEIKSAIEKQYGKELAKLDDEEKAIADFLINSIPKSHATGIAGQHCRVSVTSKEVLQADNWDDIQKYILKTKDFSILGRTLKQDVLQEYMGAGKKVPGVKVFNVTKLSINKL